MKSAVLHSWWIDQAFRKLDDGQKATAGVRDICGPVIKVFADALTSSCWSLLHGAGALTLEHHDAAGLATYLTMVIGVKVWGIVMPNGYSEAKTSSELEKLNELFVRADWDENAGELPESWTLDWEKKGGTVYPITARPGSLM